MAKILNADSIIAKSSKGLIADYYVSGGVSEQRPANLLLPNQSLLDVKSMFLDHTFNFQVNKVVNSCTINGWKIVKSDDVTKRNKEYEKKLMDLGYPLIERALFINTIIYRNAYLEIEYDLASKSPKMLHMLETTEMGINCDIHGEVVGYTQVHGSGPSAKEGYTIPFTTDEVIHIAVNKPTTSPYGFVDTQAIQHLIFYKNFIEVYLNNLFEKNKFRDVWFVGQSNASSVKSMIENVRLGDANPQKSMVIEGPEVRHETLRDMKELESLKSILEKYEDSISRFLLVPPILGGDVGGSSRSTGEYEVRYDFGTTVRAWHQIITTYLNSKLLPLLGMEGYKIVYNSFDKIDHLKAVQIAAQLKGLGYSTNAIHYYLITNGIEIPEEDLPKEMPIMGSSALAQTLQNKNAPSRQAKDPTFAGNMRVGSDSSTRENQIIAKSSRIELSKKYW